MGFIKENILEVLLLIGMLLFAIGFFIFSVRIGFIITGATIMLVTVYLNKVQQGGGE